MDCITHSGGGICLTMFLIKNPQYISKLNSITMFSCQAFGASHSLKNYIRIFSGKWVSYVLGFTPGKMIGLGRYNESYFTMQQWFDWNLHRFFKAGDGYDYAAGMKLITTPILSICSKGDTFISPVQGCMDFLSAFDNPQNRLIFCSVENGYVENYNHGSVILSKNAANEIWPMVQQWIVKRKVE